MTDAKLRDEAEGLAEEWAAEPASAGDCLIVRLHGTGERRGAWAVVGKADPPPASGAAMLRFHRRLWFVGPPERVSFGYRLGWVDEVLWVWDERDVGRGTPLRFDPAALLTTDPVRTVFVPGPDWDPDGGERFGFTIRLRPGGGRCAVESEYVEPDPYQLTDDLLQAPARTSREDVYDTRAEAVGEVAALIPQAVGLMTGWCPAPAAE